MPWKNLKTGQSTCWFWSRLLTKLFIVSINRVLELCNFLNSCWNLFRILNKSRWSMMLLNMICSITLHVTHVSDTGLKFDGKNLFPFLNIDVICALFQFTGTLPSFIICWSKSHRTGAMISALSLKICVQWY